MLDVLRQGRASEPFVPFEIHLNDDRCIVVHRRDLVMVSPGGITAIVMQCDSTFDVIEINSIRNIRPVAPNESDSASPDILRDWDREHRLARLHADGRIRAADDRARRRAATWSTSTAARYLDGVSSLWCNVHGHRHPRIDAAIREQLDRVAHVTNLGRVEPDDDPTGQAAGRLAPAGSESRLLLRRRRDGGRSRAEDGLSVLAAAHGPAAGKDLLRGARRCLSRRHAGRRQRRRRRRGFTPCFDRCCSSAARCRRPISYRLPAGRHAEERRWSIRWRRWNDCWPSIIERIAALVIEPLVQAAAGMIVHPPGYLRGVRELTRKYDVLLIADEVAVGFGRTGRMFACEHEGVTPDFLCLAKGLTGGYLPMAATLATDEIYAGLPRHYASEARPSTTATPTAAIRWARPRRWPRSTSSTRNKRWSSCQPRSRGCRELLAPHRPIIRTSATSANAG